MVSSAPLTITVQVPELTQKLHDALLAISKLALGKQTVNSIDIYTAIQGVAFDTPIRPEPSVPVEYQWGTSPFEDGTGIMMHSSEDSALWLRERRGANVYRRPVPTAWELVQP